MPDNPLPQDGIVFTERDLYAIIGELYVQRQMNGAELAQLRAQLAALTVVDSPEDDTPDAEPEPGDA